MRIILDQINESMGDINMLRLLCRAIGLFLFSCSFLWANDIAPSEKNQAILAEIKRIETRVDLENGFPWGTHGVAKGYHSNFEKGTRVHPTRSAMDFAAYLLASPETEHRKRGNKLLGKVLELQDQNPESRTFGVWPWYAEEPLEKMASVDYNWADFQGAVIAVILHDYSDRLTDEMLEKSKKALENCCRAIIKRNVGPGYTNIAMMGATVTAAAGEILDKSELLEYGRKRIQRNFEHYREVGGFNEYNSPTYTMVVVHELERMLYLVKDAECKAAAMELLGEAWKMIASHYHVPTGEWAGPHSRTYSDRLSTNTRNSILSRAGLLPRGTLSGSDILVPPMPTPNTLLHYFKETPTKPVRLKDFYAKGRPYFEVVGTTYMDNELALGSASYYTFWEQARGLIAYWTVPDAPAAVLRLRFLHDDNDFSSAWGRSMQFDTKVLTTIGVVKNQGSMHPHFDRPKDGVFRAKSFKIAYQLDAKDATARKLDAHRFELAAGPVRAVIHTTGSNFIGVPILWKIEQKKNFVAVTGVLYEGEEKPFPFHTLGDIQIATGLELLQENAPPTAKEIRFVESDYQSKEDGKFYGVLWPELNDDQPLLAPLKPTNR